MATAGKRGHTTTPGNPIFTTPAKPQSKRDKRNDAEPEDEISTEFQQAQARLPFQAQARPSGAFPVATQFTPYVQSYNPYSSSHSQNTIPTHQNISEIGGEITSVKTMLGEVLAKLNKLDTIESTTMGALSTSVEEIKIESAREKEDVDAMKKRVKGGIREK